MSFKKWIMSKNNKNLSLQDERYCENCGFKIKDHWKREGSNWVFATSCASPMPKPIKLPDAVVKDWHPLTFSSTNNRIKKEVLRYVPFYTAKEIRQDPDWGNIKFIELNEVKTILDRTILSVSQEEQHRILQEVRDWLNMGYKWHRDTDDRKRILLYFDKKFGGGKHE